MSVSIYVDGTGGNYVGAVVEDGRLAEYRIEKKNKTVTTGSVFKGKVENVLEGMQAAFVNVGLEKNGYLSAGDMLMDKNDLGGDVLFPDFSELEEGDEIMVQAVKDPSGTKGVRLTANVSFAGRLVVYMPTVEFVGVSRKADEKQRIRLLKIAEELKPKKGGLIIRTAGALAAKSEIKRELTALKKQYEKIEEDFKTATAPALLYGEGNLAVRMIRDVWGENVDKFVIADKETFDEAADYAKRLGGDVAGKMKRYNGKTDMFTAFGLNQEVGELLGNKVKLESGAYLVIDTTEALVSIDVNTGSFVGTDNLEQTVYETNLLAAKEIARQIRLRNLSGIIIVDFIDMAEKEHRAAVVRELERELERDREKASVVGMTPLGLVEITRKKRRKGSESMLLKPCPYCQGSGFVQSNDYVVMRIRTGLLDLFADGYNNAIIDLNADICDFILSTKALRGDVEKIWKGKRVYMIPHRTYHQHFFLIKGDNSKVIDLPEKAVLLY